MRSSNDEAFAGSALCQLVQTPCEAKAAVMGKIAATRRGTVVWVVASRVHLGMVVVVHLLRKIKTLPCWPFEHAQGVNLISVSLNDGRSLI